MQQLVATGLDQRQQVVWRAAGARKGVKRKPPPIVMRILKERNDTDPLLLLSTIVTTADAPLQLRAQCAIAMAP